MSYGMKQCRKAKARHRGAEMLHLIRSWRALNSLDHRHGPVIARNAANHPAERAPFVERGRREIGANMQRSPTLLGKVKSIPRRASGKSGSQRRRAPFKVRTRTADRI